jgi:ethanolamine utilization protein EutQ (cupin superfamily)
MQIADKAHTLMGYSDIEQATREDVDKSQIPAKQRKDSGNPDWKMSTQDLEKEQNKSPTSSAGLAQLKKDIGVYEETALEAVMRLSNYKK